MSKSRVHCLTEVHRRIPQRWLIAPLAHHHASHQDHTPWLDVRLCFFRPMKNCHHARPPWPTPEPITAKQKRDCDSMLRHARALPARSGWGCGLKQWAHNWLKVGPEYCRPGAAVSDLWIDGKQKPNNAAAERSQTSPASNARQPEPPAPNRPTTKQPNTKAPAPNPPDEKRPVAQPQPDQVHAPTNVPDGNAVKSGILAENARTKQTAESAKNIDYSNAPAPSSSDRNDRAQRDDLELDLPFAPASSTL